MANYQVAVTREGDSWVGEVAGLTGGNTTDAESLDELLVGIREVIILSADLDDDADIEIELTGIQA